MAKEKVHSTNYYNTLIEVAEDIEVNASVIPISKNDKKTIAEMQFNLLVNNPYTYTSDEVLFQIFADRSDLLEEAYPKARKDFFAKGQACLRASPLAKKHGFGFHFNVAGQVALYAMESESYQKLKSDPTILKCKAMRTSKK